MVWTSGAVTAFPKAQRFRLATRVEETLFRFHDLLLRATRAQDKRAILLQADLELEKLRVYFRLAQDLHCLSFKQYEHAIRLCAEIGKLLGGWLKTLPT